MCDYLRSFRSRLSFAHGAYARRCVQRVRSEAVVGMESSPTSFLPYRPLLTMSASVSEGSDIFRVPRVVLVRRGLEGPGNSMIRLRVGLEQRCGQKEHGDVESSHRL